MTEEQEHPMARRLSKWFKSNYEAFPAGIEGFVTDSHNVFCVELEEPFDVESFASLIDATSGYEAELSDSSVSVLKVDELDGGLLHKHAIGVSFHESNRIPLGAEKPIGEDGNPVDGTVQDTLSLLETYLSDKHQ